MSELSSGFSLSTALEIYSNPRDLEISIGQASPKGKYAICIGRGPGHNFKIMLSSNPFAEKLEDAVEAVKETLHSIRKIVTKELKTKGSLPSILLNPDRRSVNKLKALNSKLINWIVKQLRQHQVASTYKI